MARAYPGSLAARENELRAALGSDRWDIRIVIEASDAQPGQRFLMLEPGLGLRSDAFVGYAYRGAWVHLP